MNGIDREIGEAAERERDRNVTAVSRAKAVTMVRGPLVFKAGVNVAINNRRLPLQP